MTRDYTARTGEMGNEELFAVLQEEEQYLPEVVEAAIAELQRRNLSAQEWQSLQDAWRLEDQKRRQKAKRSLLRQAGRRGQGFLDRFNPFHREGLDRDLLMIRVSAFFIFLFDFIARNELLFQPGAWSLDKFTVLQLWPIPLVPAALYFFHKRDPLGWIILSVWCMFALVGGVYATIWTLSHDTRYFPIQAPDPTVLLIGFVAYGSLLYALNRKPVQEAVRVNGIMQWVTLLGSFALCLLLLRNS